MTSTNVRILEAARQKAQIAEEGAQLGYLMGHRDGYEARDREPRYGLIWALIASALMWVGLLTLVTGCVRKVAPAQFLELLG